MRLIRDGEPTTATSTFTQLLSSDDSSTELYFMIYTQSRLTASKRLYYTI